MDYARHLTSRRHRPEAGLPCDRVRPPAIGPARIGKETRRVTAQMHATVIRRLLAVSMAVTLLLGLAATASAHEQREVGDYKLTVGFSTEPALINEPNGLSLDVQ